MEMIEGAIEPNNYQQERHRDQGILHRPVLLDLTSLLHDRW